jgi:hypothetical protein
MGSEDGNPPDPYANLCARAADLPYAEFKTAFYLLTVRDPATNTATASNSDIEVVMGINERSVIRALASLTRRKYITRRKRGSGHLPSVYFLNITETIPFRGDTVSALARRTSTDFMSPLLDLQESRADTMSPLEGQTCHSVTTHLGGVLSPSTDTVSPLETVDEGMLRVARDPRALDDRIDIDSIKESIDTRARVNTDSIFDRTHATRPRHFRQSQLAAAARYGLKWLQLQRGQQNAQPPDPQTCAQLLTAAGGENGIMNFVLSYGKDYGADSCQYLLTMMLEKIHGIPPQAQKARRAQLRAVPASEPKTPLAENQELFADDLKSAVNQLAKAKGMK